MYGFKQITKKYFFNSLQEQQRISYLIFGTFFQYIPTKILEYIDKATLPNDWLSTTIVSNSFFHSCTLVLLIYLKKKNLDPPTVIELFYFIVIFLINFN